MYCPTSAYAMNVLSIMKMLSNASSASSVGASKEAKTFGFSVKDILDLPTNKIKANGANHKNCSSVANGAASGGGGPALDANGQESGAPTANPTGYHPALYYNAPGICDNPYSRCLPPYDMFTYSTQLRKY
jgi:hypothetical protein